MPKKEKQIGRIGKIKENKKNGKDFLTDLVEPPKRKPRVILQKQGAPSKYDPKYCQMFIDFMSRTLQEVCIDKTYYKTPDKVAIAEFTDTGKISEGGIKSETHKVMRTVFPTIERFCHNIGIHKDTLYEWEKVYPAFHDAYNKGIQMQEAILIEGGMAGEFNSSFATLYATNKFKYRNKSEVEVKDLTPSKDSEELNEEELMASLIEIRKKKALANKK